MRPLLPVSCIAAVILLSGCTGVKQMVGLDTQPPDEFNVESRAPLTIPPEFDLRPPAPGAPRPQDVSPSAKAQQALISAGPGKPGEQASGLGAYSALGAAPVQVQQLGGLAKKLLTANDVDSGIRIEKRDTTPLKGVY